MMSKRGWAVALLAIGSVALSSCVGPATTDAAYRGKALHAADAAQSAAQTAVLTTAGMLHGRVLDPYGEVVLSTAEQDASSAQQAFDSIQPPNDEASDKLRDTLDTLLTTTSSDLADLRIAARRGHTGQMASMAKELAKIASKLNSFSEEHS